tara:strand:- start:247 stop:1230 length:984 start_codon:yes stop_codon:yes gene_type:complete
MESEFKWGIIGTGGIAHAFANDLKFLSGHYVAAVGSRTQIAAEKFSNNYPKCVPYGCYIDCIKDSNVDGIYIATPHNSHAEYSILALDNGKPVLCEKPFSINSLEAKKMISMAKNRKLLIMEAMWTRFLPHIKIVREIIDDKILGQIKSLHADHGQNLSKNLNPRLWEPELGGGALLDLGIYVVSFAHLILGIPNMITAKSFFTNKGVDEQTSVIFDYSNNAQANLSMTLNNNTPCRAVISGEKGYLEIYGRFYGPTSMKLILNDGTETNYKNNYNGHGLREQAKEFARCKKLNLLESPLMPTQESMNVMKSMDEIRRQIGLKYPND